MTIYSFLPESTDSHGVPVAEEMRRLLSRYSDYTALVTPHFADAVREPDMAGELARELDISSSGLDAKLVLSYQERKVTIPAVSLVAPPPYRAQLAGETRWVFDGENRLTQAIMRLNDPRVPNVFFAYGHRELSLLSGPNAELTATRFAQALTAANMRVRQHVVSATSGLPPECDVLIIAAPRIRYGEAETNALQNYLKNGGRLLVLAPEADPGFAVANSPLNDLLFAAGGGYRDDMVEDTVHNYRGQALAPLGRARRLGEGSLEFVLPFSRSLRDNPKAEETGWQTERLIESLQTATAVSGEEQTERQGPFTLVCRSRITADEREARVAVSGSGRMASDAYIDRGANEALLVGLVQWLAGREESHDIEPRPWIDRRLHFTGPQYRSILWVGNIMLPLAWLMAGITVWWLRRK